ncbi:MAG: FHA domain-containing protein [Anaerolineae bacterium]|nr:FHA domain-containing protein [Anaerolineae bacterium]
MRGKTISGATAVLIIAFFFLPWFSVSFNGRGLGQFSGYQLAVGGSVYALDGLNGRSILFFIPLSALIVLILFIVEHYKPAWQMPLAVWEILVASLGLIVLGWQWRGSGGNENLVFSTEPGLWLTLFSFGLVVIGIGLASRESGESGLTGGKPSQAAGTAQPEVETIIASPLAHTPLQSETKTTPPPAAKATTRQIKPEIKRADLSMKVWLVVAEGEMAGAKFHLIPPMRIGRDPGNDIVIDDNSMSGYHAVVREQGGAYHIQDLNSTNGIYLENQSSHRWQRVPAATLVDEMHIKLGRTVFYVVVEDN